MHVHQAAVTSNSPYYLGMCGLQELPAGECDPELKGEELPSCLLSVACSWTLRGWAQTVPQCLHKDQGEHWTNFVFPLAIWKRKQFCCFSFIFSSPLQIVWQFIQKLIHIK